VIMVMVMMFVVALTIFMTRMAWLVALTVAVMAMAVSRAIAVVAIAGGQNLGACQGQRYNGCSHGNCGENLFHSWYCHLRGLPGLYLFLVQQIQRFRLILIQESRSDLNPGQIILTLMAGVNTLVHK